MFFGNIVLKSQKGLKLTCEQEEGENHDGGVTEVQEGRCGSLDLELGDEVVDAVDEKVERGEAACQVAAPPPVVVLLKNKTLKMNEK